MKACFVIPFYRHEGAIAATLAAVKPHGLPCFLVDDGSGRQADTLLTELAARESGWLTLLRLSPNRGKGAAVMAGIEAATRAGFSHALQLDADGQHNTADIPRLLEIASAHPTALVTGVAQYDASVPRSRLYGRYVTHVWVWINTLSFRIRDSMCGFRVYPVAPALAAWRGMRWGRRMDFDTEILVRMFWAGVPVLGVPTHVTYPADGVSHFDLWRDNLRISWMHARLFVGMLWRMPWLLARRVAGRSP
jgi:glycosyltransferase involved in cell wall biosynthesis